MAINVHCLQVCSGQRKGPSSSYYQFPHRHSDGLRCTHRCTRIEERERKRKLIEKEHRLVAKSEKTFKMAPWLLIRLDPCPPVIPLKNVLPGDPRGKRAHISRNMHGLLPLIKVDSSLN